MARSRIRLNDPPEESGGLYDYEEPEVKEFIPSGCTLLDRVLGGGWAMRRVSNIIGDKSTNKTGLAIEACINFARKYPKNRSRIYFRESEAAFDRSYAAGWLGFPLDRVDFLPDGEFVTVEDFNRDIRRVTDKHKDGKDAVLYIVDSLDALSDEAEQKMKDDDKTYGAAKAKQMSQFFRQRVQSMKNCNMHLMVISQIRDKINAAAFGKKTTRSGGHALDFYASQIIELALIEHLNKTIGGVKRDVGIQIRARCSKNKITTPYQTCDFPLLFNFGVDNVRANIEWLDEVGFLADFQGDYPATKSAELRKKFIAKTISSINKMDDDDYDETTARLDEVTISSWKTISKKFEPLRRKYR